MNFETKYLIRWGIPGWVFLISISFILIPWIFEVNEIKNFLSLNNKQLLSIALAILGFGVPIGYILHQLHFISFWLGNLVAKLSLNYIVSKIDNFPFPENWKGSGPEDYYYIEYLWQRELSKINEENKTYISERYRHLLATTHSLGALSQSFLSPTVLSMVLGVVEKNWFYLLPGTFFGLFTIMMLINHMYYSKMSMYFQAKFLNDFLNGTYKPSEN